MKIPEILIVETVHQPGSLARVLQVIADAGLTIEHLSALRRDQGRTLWEITLEMDEETDRSLYERIGAAAHRALPGQVRSRLQPPSRRQDPHRGEPAASTPLQILRDVYTPGWRASALRSRRTRSGARVHRLARTVAVVTNGTAVLGLGNIGALAGLPVMEGKAALFAETVGINGVPILMNETEPARVVAAVHGHRGLIRCHPPGGLRSSRVLRDRADTAGAPGEAGAAR